MTEYEYLLQELANAAPSAEEIPDLPELYIQQKVIDGDTIRNEYDTTSRFKGFDTFESDISSKKAKALADDYGLDYETQQRLGEQGKAELERALSSDTVLNPEGTDYYGRDLVSNQEISDRMIAAGYAVPAQRYDSKSQNLYRRKLEKEDKLYGTNSEKEALKAQRDYNLDATAPSIGSMLGESIDALQAGTVRLLADTGDMVLDAAKFWGDGNSDLLDEFKKQENIDKLTGYDRREAEFRIDETLHDFKQGNYFEGVANMIPVAPQIFAESVPMMVGMLFGAGKFTALGKAVNAAKSAKEVASLKAKAGLGEKLLLGIADQAGFTAVLGGQINNRLEERK